MTIKELSSSGWSSVKHENGSHLRSGAKATGIIQDFDRRGPLGYLAEVKGLDIVADELNHLHNSFLYPILSIEGCCVLTVE